MEETKSAWEATPQQPYQRSPRLVVTVCSPIFAVAPDSRKFRMPRSAIAAERLCLVVSLLLLPLELLAALLLAVVSRVAWLAHWLARLRLERAKCHILVSISVSLF